MHLSLSPKWGNGDLELLRAVPF